MDSFDTFGGINLILKAGIIQKVVVFSIEY